MDNKEKTQPNDFGLVLLQMAKMVVKGELGLRDDRSLLIPKEELLRTLKPITTRDIQKLIDNELIVPVEEDVKANPLYHAVICIEFLRFIEKLEQAGFPLVLRQAVAEMYQSLFWALSSDVEYEIKEFNKENGREPNKLELAYLRVISDWAVSNTIIKIEEDILAGKPEELNRIKERAARWKKASLKEARLGYAEGEIEQVIKIIWKPPYKYFREREIKAFIDISSLKWTKEEASLIWGGHFDFALCDERGTLCLAIDYQGNGHYGKTEADKRKVISRDIAKHFICDKAGIPLVQLEADYAFNEKNKRLLQNFLYVFLKRRHDYNLAIKLVVEQLERIGSTTAFKDPRLENIRHRLDIYKIQENGESILSLLWDLHKLQTPSLSPLPIILSKLDY